MATIIRNVDEQGRMSGFTPADDDLEVGQFGDGLDGEEVTLDDGRTGTVTKVYGHIQTGPQGSGTSNYVGVEIELDE